LGKRLPRLGCGVKGGEGIAVGKGTEGWQEMGDMEREYVEGRGRGRRKGNGMEAKETTACNTN